MTKTSTDTQITFRQSRRILLALAPVAVLIAAANALRIIPVPGDVA